MVLADIGLVPYPMGGFRYRAEPPEPVFYCGNKPKPII